MTDSESERYVPDIVPEADREFYENDPRYGHRVGWGETPAVLVVDMTFAFTENAPSGGERVITANEQLLGAAREAGVPVFYAKPSPPGTYPEGYPVVTKAAPASSRGPDLDGSDDNYETWRTKLVEMPSTLEPQEGEPVVEKGRASAFFDTHLSNMLHYEDVDTLVVAGMTTSVCVRATVVDSHSSNFRTIVPEECVADPAEISHEVGLFDMDTKFADVTPLAEVIERLSEMRNF